MAGGRVPRTCARAACRPQPRRSIPDALQHPQAAAVSRKRPLDRDRRRCVALLVTPFAVAAGEGRPVLGGSRNPSSNESLAYSRETQIIANNATYGTRQSNKSTSGGGAIYGCRARTGTKACLRASNLSNGRAFSFATSSGTEVGRIEGPTAAAPFTTTATGVATGLNADKVDGKDAATISADANLFAPCPAAGALGAPARRDGGEPGRPAPAPTRSPSPTTSRSAHSARPRATVTNAGSVAVELGADNKTVLVLTRDNTNAAADRPFHLTVTC